MIPLTDAKGMVGPGWHGLLEVAYAAKPEGVEVTDVKEKYGRLDIFIGAGPDDYFDLLHEIWRTSGYICEVCGKAGHQRRICGWISTLCDGCAAKREAEYKARMEAGR